MNILLDMDEVLADFVGGACKVFGVCPEAIKRDWDPAQWGMEHGLTKVLGREVTTAELWKEIEAWENFWLELEPLWWFNDIVELANSYDQLFEIVTTPSRDPMCYAHKVLWLRKQMADEHICDRLTLTRRKWKLANNETVLIDDRDSTIQMFVEHGGHGIVFPRAHNSEHKYADNPVTRVKARLEELTG